ncbi:hypothetical protein RV06_GL003071 [Enterococcus haemoperoxidus]|nr:hypothetical protein RV06_GL003071 [Enterococcus haemoperoxidus]
MSAIEYHTTVKREFTQMDMIVFLADKIKWDQLAELPYLSELLLALDTSIEKTSLVYLDYLLNSSQQLFIHGRKKHKIN